MTAADVRTFLIRHATVTMLLMLLVLGSAAAFLKLEYLGTTKSSDYETYLMTAEYLSGERIPVPGDISIPQRLLKPAYPAYLAVTSRVVDAHTAALAQAVFFYFLFIIAMYFLAREFLEDTFLAMLTTALSVFSYPVLKYGLDVYTETGSWFTYALSLWLTLLFLKRPSSALFAANVLVITLGFLWKEYVIVAAIVFGLALVFHSALSVRAKLLSIGAYAAIFLAVHVPWQLYVFHVFDFSYVDWYLQGGADGFGYEFTLKNILKSTAALLGVMWLLVPFGFSKLRSETGTTRLFAYLSTSVPLIGYAWGFISSRLLYVIAPPMLLLAALGMRGWARRSQILLVVLAVLTNVGWLVLSYRVSL